MSKKPRSARRHTAQGDQAAPVASGAPTTRVWERPWFPAAVFALLSMAYFHELPLTDNIIYGTDIGTDFHRGARLSVWEKVQTLAQPRWNPQMGGYPQYEEIRHQYFPTRLFYFFTTYQRHLGWRYIATMFAAGLGMYAYLRALGLGRWTALWGGTAYMSAPTFLTFPLAGHYAKMAVIALLPFMFLQLERGMSEGRPMRFAWLALLIGMAVYSPHLQMLYYALWGLGFYFVYKLTVLYRQTRDSRVAALRTGLFAAAVTAGLGLGAEGLIPSYLYTKTESKRAASDEAGGGRSAEEQLAFARSWSLHPEEVGSLVVPEFGGFMDTKTGDHYWGRNAFKLNSESFGAISLILALSVVPMIRRRSLLLFMSLLFVFALSFALGPYTPVHWLFFNLAPGAGVLRTPGMIAFLFAFAACVMAAFGLQRVIGEDEQATRPTLIAGGGVFALAAVLAAAPAAMTDSWIGLFYSGIDPAKRMVLENSYPWLARGAGYVALVVAVGTVLMYLRLQRRISTELLVAGLVLLTLVDTWRIDQLFLRYENARGFSNIRDENPHVVEFLRKQEGLFRILPLPDPSYRTLKQPGMHLFGMTTVTGSHDFTPKRYDRMLAELHPLQGWLNARARGQQIEYTDAALLAAFRPLLNLLNAHYLVTPRVIELKAAAFPQVFAADNFRVYENAEAMPWFYLVAGVRVEGDGERALEQLKGGSIDLRRTVLLESPLPAGFDLQARAERRLVGVRQLAYDPDAGLMRVRTEADGPGVLVISENFHPYWRAFVDGVEADVYRANYIWMGVPVDGGEHVVELRYESTAVNISRWAVLLSAIGIAALCVWDYKLRSREGRRER